MKTQKPNTKGWVEGDPEEEEELYEDDNIQIELPQLPQLRVKARKQVKKFKLDGNSEGTNIHSKKHTKRRTYYR
jgi:hypothetical protein